MTCANASDFWLGSNVTYTRKSQIEMSFTRQPHQTYQPIRASKAAGIAQFILKITRKFAKPMALTIKKPYLPSSVKKLFAWATA